MSVHSLGCSAGHSVHFHSGSSLLLVKTTSVLLDFAVLVSDFLYCLSSLGSCLVPGFFSVGIF